MSAWGPQLALEVWDAGQSVAPVWRPVLLLERLYEEENVVVWPLGRRNRALLRFLQETAGPVLEVFDLCRICGARVEFTLPCNALLRLLAVKVRFSGVGTGIPLPRGPPTVWTS